MGAIRRSTRATNSHRLPSGTAGILATLFFLVAALTAAPAQAGPAATAAADYAGLLEWQFSETTTPVPGDGISFSRDTAQWTLESGSLRQMRPTSGGAVTAGAKFSCR